MSDPNSVSIKRVCGSRNKYNNKNNHRPTLRNHPMKNSSTVGKYIEVTHDNTVSVCMCMAGSRHLVLFFFFLTRKRSFKHKRLQFGAYLVKSQFKTCWPNHGACQCGFSLWSLREVLRLILHGTELTDRPCWLVSLLLPPPKRLETFSPNYGTLDNSTMKPFYLLPQSLMNP